MVEKFASQHKTDLVFGTLFSNVVVGTAPAAGELKMPYYVVSEGHHVASGKLNRYCFQPGITDVKSQVLAVAPWIAGNLGKKVTMIFPDYAFGYDHRDYFPPAIETQGGKVMAKIAIPPTEKSFTRYFPQIPSDTDVIYHVMVGPAVLTFVKELGEFYGGQGAADLRLHRFARGGGHRQPRASNFSKAAISGKASPRYLQPDATDCEKAYREAVGIDDNGAAIGDPKDVSTAAHMFGCWETLYVIKQAMEEAGYQGPRRPPEAGRGDRGADDVPRRHRASAGRQDLQRQDPSVLRPPEHLAVQGRQAERRPSHGDRGRPLRAGSRLHEDVVLRRLARGNENVYTSSLPQRSDCNGQGSRLHDEAGT